MSSASDYMRPTEERIQLPGQKMNRVVYINSGKKYLRMNKQYVLLDSLTRSPESSGSPDKQENSEKRKSPDKQENSEKRKSPDKQDNSEKRKSPNNPLNLSFPLEGLHVQFDWSVRPDKVKFPDDLYRKHGAWMQQVLKAKENKQPISCTLYGRPITDVLKSLVHIYPLLPWQRVESGYVHSIFYRFLFGHLFTLNVASHGKMYDSVNALLFQGDDLTPFNTLRAIGLLLYRTFDITHLNDISEVAPQEHRRSCEVPNKFPKFPKKTFQKQRMYVTFYMSNIFLKIPPPLTPFPHIYEEVNKKPDDWGNVDTCICNLPIFLPYSNCATIEFTPIGRVFLMDPKYYDFGYVYSRKYYTLLSPRGLCRMKVSPEAGDEHSIMFNGPMPHVGDTYSWVDKHGVLTTAKSLWRDYDNKKKVRYHERIINQCSWRIRVSDMQTYFPFVSAFDPRD